MKISLLFLVLYFSFPASGQVTNLKTGLWSDPSVWSNNALPVDTTNIILTYDIVIDINASCKSLNTNGHKVTVNSGVTVSVNGIKNSVVTDIDGNSYETVILGNQVWMKQNLNVSHYKNGDEIPMVQDSGTWVNQKIGAWCYYENNTENGKIYGKLYNSYAVNDPGGLAPEGWKIPSDTDWTAIIDYLGGEDIAGGKMKDTTLWKVPNTGATNISGFTGLPGGFYYGRFEGLGTDGNFWYLQPESGFGRARNLYYSSDNVWEYDAIKPGYSVRCVKVNLPTITDFIPKAAGRGNSVTITGTNFTAATSVKFGDINASSFLVNSPTSISAIVDTGGTGKLMVSIGPYTATSSADFEYDGSTSIQFSSADNITSWEIPSYSPFGPQIQASDTIKFRLNRSKWSTEFLVLCF